MIEDAEEKDLSADTDKYTITEAELELENIHSYLDPTLPTPTMNSGIMNVHHNDPENFIDDTEYFLQYCS